MLSINTKGPDKALRRMATRVTLSVVAVLPAGSSLQAGVAELARSARKMSIALLTLIAYPPMTYADIPPVPESASPDGKIHAVMDVDRDPQLVPEWKDDDFPRIEITEKDTGRVLASVEYFGSPGDDGRPLREHVSVRWRADSQAFAITISDRFYSHSAVYAMDPSSRFVSVPFPSYQRMTGFPPPDSEHLRPRGRATVEGWDKDGRLIYDLFAVPLPSLTGTDPLIHRIYLDVSAAKMTPLRVEHEKGEWRNGDWIPIKAKQDGGRQPAIRPASK